MYDVGEIAPLCHIAPPQVGVVTNVGPVHLERLGRIERIAQAKAELVQALPADGVAVLNLDDARVAAMASQTQARIFWYGLSPDADLWADEIQGEGLDGIRFRFHWQSEVLHVRVPLLGRHSVHTALRAAAVGLVEGLSWEEIVRGLQQLDVQLRLITARGLNGATVLDDTYNASPASTMAALNLLADLTVQNGRRIAVLGDMLELGSYEEEGHRKVGARAADVVEHAGDSRPAGARHRPGGGGSRVGSGQGAGVGRCHGRAERAALDPGTRRCGVGQGLAGGAYGRNRHGADGRA